MGEARRRKAEIEQLKRRQEEWLAALDAPARKIADTAMRAHERIVERRGLVGGCYLLAFFLGRNLRGKGVPVEIVVGWVNDGTSPLMSSHAWVEWQGRKTDISLTRTENREAQPPGALLMLDHIVRPGKAIYTYHRERSAEALAFQRELEPMAPGLIAHKEREHRMMQEASVDNGRIAAYLDAAPPDRNYAALLRMLE
jgi:Transglutaminase-like superfamily